MTTRDDTVQIDGFVSFREAILAANSNSPVGDAPAGSAGADEITFPVMNWGWRIFLVSGPLPITEDLAILGLATEPLTLNTNSQFSHFAIADCTVTIEHGRFYEGTRVADPVDQSGGGSIHATNSNLILRDVEFADCTSSGNGGAIYHAGGTLNMSGVRFSQNAALNGGALFLSVSAGADPVIDATEFAANSSLVSGGAVALELDGSDAYFSRCRFANNEAELGGAVATLDLQAGFHSPRFVSCEFRNNLARRRGGAIHAQDSRLIVHSSLFAENRATDPNQENRGDGGAIFLDGGKTAQMSATSFLANAAERSGGALFIAPQTTVGVHSAVFEGNRAEGTQYGNGGGAVYNNGGTIRISVTRFNANYAPEALAAGGALHALGGLTVGLFDCEFTLNWARRSGGAVEIVDGIARFGLTHFGRADSPRRGNYLQSPVGNNPGSNAGGALSITSHQNSSRVLVMDSFFCDNQADLGGAIFVGVGSSLQFRVAPTTLSRNAAILDGGAVYLAGEICFLTTVGIDQNSAGRHGGGIFLAASAEINNLSNATITNNSPDDIFPT